MPRRVGVRRNSVAGPAPDRQVYELPFPADFSALDTQRRHFRVSAQLPIGVSVLWQLPEADYVNVAE